MNGSEGSGRDFEFLEHTADILVRAYGRSLEEALVNIARGMFEVITDTSKISPTMGIKIEVCGYDLYNLVYRWLEELLYYHDSQNFVFGRFNIELINEKIINGEKFICLNAYAYGEIFDNQKHEPRTVVKAVTYHQMRIENVGSRWVIDVVFDI